MRRITYMRHGHKTPDNHITEETKPIVQAQAKAANTHDLHRTEWIFFGELIRTKETAEEARQALLGTFPRVDDDVLRGPYPGIGSDVIFNLLLTDKLKQGVKNGLSNFEAMRQSMDENTFRSWCSFFAAALLPMFSFLSIDEGRAIACGHSPCIEMAAYAVTGFDPEFISSPYAKLAECDALIFLQNDRNEVNLVKKKLTAPSAAELAAQASVSPLSGGPDDFRG